MKSIRNVVILALMLGGAFVALFPDRRRAAAEKLARARRLVTRKFADGEARAGRLATEAWDNEGGAAVGGGGAPR
jgi:hypothetical protein